MLIDNYHRHISYLRISLTDRCNLRCIYCMPKEGISLLGHSEILSLEEIERIASAAARLGISRIRITGGEPLVRKGVIELAGDLLKLPGIEDVSLTTNGILLTEGCRGEGGILVKPVLGRGIPVAGGNGEASSLEMALADGDRPEAAVGRLKRGLTGLFRGRKSGGEHGAH